MEEKEMEEILSFWKLLKENFRKIDTDRRYTSDYVVLDAIWRSLYDIVYRHDGI